ncbi:MAG: thiamine phosphate synthase [Campylobacter sp.]|nr:thiamine phosphate synthase [Campylobacter sp.]
MSEIYALSDDILSPDELILQHAKQILQSGVKLYQYRNKGVKNPDIAKKLLELCHNFGAKFIVNDDVNFAKFIGANCVHIGKDDADIQTAREILGKKAFIGVSCYDDINLALNAQKMGASYVAFGAMFASKTKPDAKLAHLQTLSLAKQNLQIPVCAIGGINASNIKEISKIGVDYIAVVRAIYEPKSISENIANLQKAML